MGIRTTPRQIPSFQPDVQLIGDWKKASLLLHTLDATVMAAAKAGEYQAAEKFRDAIKRNIRNNGSAFGGWTPLSESYQKRKTSLGYDSNRILYMTGAYYRNITIWSTGSGRFYVGLKRYTKHPSGRGKLTLAQIARVLEYGSAKVGIAPRPLWKPTFKQFGGTARFKKIILWHIYNAIKMTYGIKVKVRL